MDQDIDHAKHMAEQVRRMREEERKGRRVLAWLAAAWVALLAAAIWMSFHS